MRRRLVGGAIALLVGTLYACGDGAVWGDDRVDADGVHRCFAAYRDRVGAADGTAVAALVSAQTHQFFGSLRDIALMGDRETVAGLPIYRKIQALALRATIPAKDLEAMSEEEVFAAVVSRGWIDGSMLNEIELGEIEGDTNSAVAALTEAGEDTDQGISFVREEDHWRVDLFQALGESDRFEKTEMIRLGMSEEDYVMMRLNEYTGEEVPVNVWTPPGSPD